MILSKLTPSLAFMLTLAIASSITLANPSVAAPMPTNAIASVSLNQVSGDFSTAWQSHQFLSPVGKSAFTREKPSCACARCSGLPTIDSNG